MARPVPALVLRLLERRLPPRLFDDVAGDIEERWRRDEETSSLWAWLQLLRLTASLVWHTSRERHRAQCASSVPRRGTVCTSILQDLRFSLRLSARQPWLSAAAVVSPDLLPLLGVSPRLGRNFAPKETAPNGPPAVILTHETWVSRFGAREDIIGERVTLSGAETTIVGVLPREVRLLNYPADVWQPLRMTAADWSSESRMLWVMGRLAGDTGIGRATAEADAIMRERSEGRLGARAVPLQEQTLGPLMRDVPLLFGAAAFVLFIACANVASLTLARIAGRHEELVVRRALGASRARILRQILTESVALGVAGGAAGLLFASWAVRAVVMLAPRAERLPDVTIGSPVIFLFAFSAATITGAAFGLAPAWRSARAQAGSVMRAGGHRIAGGRQPLLRAVIVGEVALALALLAGASLVARSYHRLSSVDLGFDPTGVMAFELWRPAAVSPEASIAFYDEVLRTLSATSGIQSAGLTQALPLRSGAMGAGFVVEGHAAEPASVLAFWRIVSPDFLETLSIPLIAGRGFDARDREGGEQTAIVTASFAQRAWPGAEAVGKRIGWGNFERPLTVVGVAGDVRVSPGSPPEPHVDLPYRQADGWLPHQLVVRSDLGAAATIDIVRRTVAAIDSVQPVSGVTSMEALQERSMGRRRFRLALFSIAAGVAVLLALVGIYGVLSYAGAQMSGELGLRLGVGASRPGLLWHVMRMGLAPAMIGIALGSVVAWWGAGLLRGFLFDVEPRQAGVVAAAAAVLTLASIAACLLPAWRAARTDPLITMRPR
jgi:predicted permease